MKEKNQNYLGNKKVSNKETETTFPISLFNSQQLTISTLKLNHHESIDDILSATSKLTKELGIQLKKVYRAHTSMTAFLYPKSGKYRIVIANVLYDFLYYIDDLFGEDIEVSADEELPSMTEMMNIWKTGKINPEYFNGLISEKVKNICTAMLWIRAKLYQSSEPAFFKRLSVMLFDHLKDQLEPKDYNTVDEYIMLRRGFSGMYPVVYLVEYCNNKYLNPETIAKLPNLQKAIDACVDIGGLSNDIFSYPKESHSKFNLVNSYMVENPDVTLAEAVQKSIDLVNRCHADFNDAIKALPNEITHLDAEEKATILQFANGMKHIVSASYHWQFVTQRFRHDNHILEDLKSQSDYFFNADT